VRSTAREGENGRASEAARESGRWPCWLRVGLSTGGSGPSCTRTRGVGVASPAEMDRWMSPTQVEGGETLRRGAALGVELPAADPVAGPTGFGADRGARGDGRPAIDRIQGLRLLPHGFARKGPEEVIDG
jgi:hypothetical protein